MLKYKNRPTYMDGYRFASKAEAERYLILKMLLKSGQIQEFSLQPKFPLHAPDGTRIGHYIADFLVVDKKGAKWAEDVKGVRTQLFNWKAKHFRAEYPHIELRIIK
ncbi:MAG: DUF1064 domain-containing protein [Turicibacter sp.]|nr:DUF1064 domain-containing protein [Turicibacter sp.]